MRARMQKNPRRRRHSCDRTRLRFSYPASREYTRCARDQRRFRIRWPGKNRNGHQSEDASPILPLADLHEVIRSHQPDKAAFREARQQQCERVGGMRRSEPSFDVRHADAGVHRDASGGLQSFVERGSVAGVLQRVLRRQHPPDFVEPQPLQGKKRNMPMPLMGRVEGPTKQADSARSQGSHPRAIRCRRRHVPQARSGHPGVPNTTRVTPAHRSPFHERH